MYRAKITLGFAILLLITFFNWNCTKIDNTELGGGLIPVVDNVHTFDTVLSVIANNFDSVSKDCAKVFPGDFHSLGYISNDPYFGTTKSFIFAEFKPPFFPYTFPVSRSLDSIVLVLSYKSAFGDSTVPQKVDVFPISNTFTPDSSSCKSYEYDFAKLGSTIYSPAKLNDSSISFRERETHQLRIKLDNAFGQALLAQDSSTGFKSDTAFKNFFKGFAIVPDFSFGGNALSYFNLTDSNSKLAIYFKYTTATNVTDTTVYNFRMTNFSGNANTIERNHSGSEVLNHLGHPEEGDDVIYIQTTPGTSAEIKIPGLSGVSNRIIHRAELIMDQVYSPNTLDDVFATPSLLYLDLKDTAGGGSYRPIPCDFNTLSGQPNIATFGGYRTIAKDPFGNDISRYIFNISRYVQKVVTNGRLNSTLRLRAPADIINPAAFVDECNQGLQPFTFPVNVPTIGRVKLGGGNNTNYRMRLRIVYSNL
ncbi:MAG: DUF4270 family protein [Ginsengibacter sp.]